MKYALLEYKRPGPYRNLARSSILSYLNKGKEMYGYLIALYSIYNICVSLKAEIIATQMNSV